MQYSTQAKTYGNPQGAVNNTSNSTQGVATNGNKQIQSSLSYKITDKKQIQTRRTSLMENPKNDELFGAFPQLVISRVDSAEHKEKLKSNQSSSQSGGNVNHLTTSLIAKTNRGDLKIVSTSMDKSSNYYAGSRQYISSNQSDTNKASYRVNYATYKRDTNLAPNYSNGANQQDGSDNQGNQVASYRPIGKYMTLQKMDMEISPHMVSSVYSREERSREDSSSQKNQRIYQSTRSRNKEDVEGEKAYDLYASRHPDQSIRRSTIQISKAISSNAITQLENQNSNQEKKIKKLEKELGQFKSSLKKWDEIKYRYTMDLESKSRQIFDLQRANKRLTEQVQGIRTYRTMDTVQQVIIVRLKEQIMQLNKKIIEMQAQYYKNQKSLLQKASKKQIKIEQQNDKQAIKKQEQAIFMSNKEIELLSVELQKQKEKSWKLQQQKQQYLAEKTLNKENYEKQITLLKKDMNGLRQETQKHLQTVHQRQVAIEQIKNSSQHEIRKITQNITRQVQQQKRLAETQANLKSVQIQKLHQQLIQKDKILDQKLFEQKSQLEAQVNQRLASKQQESKNMLNNEIKNIESQINSKATAQIQRLSAQLVEKDKTTEQKLSEQKRIFEKQLGEKLNQKQQQYKTALNNQMRLFESKMSQQGRNEKIKQSENKQLLERLRQQKQQVQNQLRRKIAEFEQGLKAANLRLTQKDEQIRAIQSKDKNIQQVSGQYMAELENLRKALFDNENYIRDVQNQNENIKAGIRERDLQIQHLRVDNMKIVEDFNREVREKAKWKQEQSFVIEKQISRKVQEQYRQKERELESRSASLASQQQNIKQLKVQLEQGQQQQLTRVQNELKQKQQKIQGQLREKQQKSIKQLQSTKMKLIDEVKKVQMNLGAVNKQFAVANSKKMQVESEINLKKREVNQIQAQIIQVKRDLQGKLTELAQVQSKKRNLTAQTEKLKQVEQKQRVVNKQYQNKYNAAVSQLNTFKIQYSKLQQKAHQAQIEVTRAKQNINMWKLKHQTSESSVNKIKAEFSALEKQKEETKVKLREAQENKAKTEIAKKYEELLPEFEIVKQKLKLKEQQSANRESNLLKLRQVAQSGESKASALTKQIRNIRNKVDQTQSRFKAILTKVELEEYKYKQLYDKLVKDSQIYMGFIKRLQQENELIAQKYWKVRKLVKKQKISEEHELVEKKDETELKKFLQAQILSHFKKMIVPACEAKILEKLAECESNISQKEKKLARIQGLVQRVVKKGEAERAKSKN